MESLSWKTTLQFFFKEKQKIQERPEKCDNKQNLDTAAPSPPHPKKIICQKIIQMFWKGPFNINNMV